MKQAICIILAACIAAAGCASGKRQVIRDDSTGVVNHTDAQHGLRLTYGGEWSEQRALRPRGAILVLIAEDGGAGLPPTVTVTAQREPAADSATPDLRDVERNLVERLRTQIDDFELVEAADATIGGEPARRIAYTGRRMGMSMQVLNLITLRHGRGYAFAYMSDPATYGVRVGEVERMIESVQWMN